jgi:hypothetical protein
MNATNQSGHVGNGRCVDMIEPRRLAGTGPTYWDEAELKKAGVQRLLLKPR